MPWVEDIHHLCNTQVQERGVFAMQVALVVVCWPFSFQRSCCPQAVCVLPLGVAHVLAAVLMLLLGPDAPLIIFLTFTQ